MKTNKQITILLMACVTVFLITCPAWGAKTIKIGVIGPMQFVQGKGHWNGATMAAEEINAKGGVNVGGKMMKIDTDQGRFQRIFKRDRCHQCHGTAGDP